MEAGGYVCVNCTGPIRSSVSTDVKMVLCCIMSHSGHLKALLGMHIGISGSYKCSHVLHWIICDDILYVSVPIK